MRSLTVVAGCVTLLLVACGNGGTASGGDAFCAGAERLDEANRAFEEIVVDVVEMIDETGLDQPARAEAAMETLSPLSDVAGQAIAAVDEMIAGADGDLRRDLEAVRDQSGATLAAVAGADSLSEIEAALSAEAADSAPDSFERAQRIDDATQNRCGVAFVRNPLEAVINAAVSGPAPWPDVDVCSLLPPAALTDAGVVDTVGAVDDAPPTTEGCEWGDRYSGEGAHVRLSLWNPPSPRLLEDFWEEHGEVAGRTAYVEDGESERACRVAVDNGGFVVIVAVDLFSVSPDRRTGPACDHADGLAATALSSLPGDA